MVDICTLPSRGVFRVTGSDTSHWLQDLVTNDIDRLETEAALYAALLSPQGKILFDFIVYGAPDGNGGGVLIDCEAAALDALVKRLSMYRLRSNVKLTPEPDLGVISSCTPLDAALAFVEVAARDPRLEKLGYRMIGDRDRMQAEYEAQGHRVDGEDVYRDYLLELGVPNGAADFAPGKAYPLESNFEELSGVSFSKGCFIGQEVIARMKHKTELRKRVLPVSVDDDVLVVGADIRAGSAKAGTILSSSGNKGLALVRLEEWQEAREANVSLEADGALVSVSVPDWLTLKGGA